MILVTLGTISYPFDRAIRWLEICLTNQVILEPVFIQHGATDVSPLIEHPLITAKSTVPLDQWLELVNQSRLIISHAGQGSTRILAENHASFFLLPRLSLYREHVDDHQAMFAQSIRHTGITSCSTIEEFQWLILNPPPAFKGNVFEGPRLADYLLEKYS
ncbi:glycosyl transferase [bacterium]|nr:glycosyl transferase [bacterium]